MKENSIENIIEEKYTRYLNCETDIIGLTLEEAMFILKTNERRNYVISIVQEACKVLLSDYKRVLKENEELKKFITEGITVEPNSPYKNYQLDFLRKNFIPRQNIKDKIEEVNKIYKELLESEE